MARSLLGDFVDTIVPSGNGVVLRYTFRKKGKVHKIYHYVSSICDVTVLNSGTQVFPVEGKIRAYNIFLVLDLPEPLEFNSGEELQIRYENSSGGNVRIVSGFTGAYD
jgi:hypothetical protein